MVALYSAYTVTPPLPLPLKLLHFDIVLVLVCVECSGLNLKATSYTFLLSGCWFLWALLILSPNLWRRSAYMHLCWCIKRYSCQLNQFAANQQSCHMILCHFLVFCMYNYGGVIWIKVNSHVKMGLSMSCTSLSTSIRKSTVTSRSPLMSQKSRIEQCCMEEVFVFLLKTRDYRRTGPTIDITIHLCRMIDVVIIPKFRCIYTIYK